MSTTSIVKISSLSHRYSAAWAVDGVSLEITRKGVYGLLGSNGAGKSTTMNILCGVLNQTKGEVYINGVDIRKDPIRAKRHLGFLPQVLPLYLDLSVVEYLKYCGRLRDVPNARLGEAVEEVMEKCGVTHVKDRLLKNLSGGYRQRVGIAQAIIHKPELVVLDEPTNGLDPVQIIEVRNLIRDLGQDHTVIFSSHILSEIQLTCQEIIMIERGRLVFSDSMEAFNNYIAPQSLLLEMENDPGGEVLSRMEGITRVERLKAGSYRLFYDGSKRVSEQIVARSVTEGWRLTQLSIEKNSVDEIFRQLTKKA